jgi:hypothetical protein
VFVFTLVLLLGNVIKEILQLLVRGQATLGLALLSRGKPMNSSPYRLCADEDSPSPAERERAGVRVPHCRGTWSGDCCKRIIVTAH